MIDADPAKRLTRWSMLLTLPKSLRVIISQGERFIQDEISDAQSKTTFLLIDLEGSASRLTSFAIAEFDLVVIPSGEEQQDADAVIKTLAEIEMETDARHSHLCTMLAAACASWTLNRPPRGQRTPQRVGQAVNPLWMGIPASRHRLTSWAASNGSAKMIVALTLICLVFS